METEKPSFWDSTFMQIVRWLFLLPVGLGVLVLAELLINMVVVLALSVAESLSVVFLIFGIMGFVSLALTTVVFISMFATMVTQYLAPNVRVGTVLVGVAYIFVQSRL